MKLKHFLLTALLLFAGVSGVYATRHYVGFASGNTDNNKLSEALGAAGPNDTVFVAAGLYIASNSEFIVPENVTLIGGYEKGDIGARTRRYPGQFVPFTTSDLSNTTEFTILDGNAHRKLPADKRRVVTVNAGGVVDGCLIRNGHVRNGNGGGAFLNGGKLYNSIVRGNVVMNHPDSAEALGGGVFIQENGELINCLVAYNMANDGYGVAAGVRGGKMINNTITANTYSPVFAKIPGGTFQMYKSDVLLDYRNPDWLGDTIPKWPQLITLRDFYISRILTTQGQFAVFCAAIDIPMNGTEGRINVDTLKLKWPNPVGGGLTLDDRYGIGSSNATGLRVLLEYRATQSEPGLKYDDGVWHPKEDTTTVEYPMGFASWFGALAYSVWLGGGLPTFAQWQFAARREPNGTVNDNLYSGAYGTKKSADIDTWRILDTIAWVANTKSIDTTPLHNLGISGTSRPHEVARKRPNAMGIYDMTGNAQEWCGDRFAPVSSSLYSSSTDPINSTVGTFRIYAGGRYDSDVRNLFSLPNHDGFYHYFTFYSGTRPVVVF